MSSALPVHQERTFGPLHPHPLADQTGGSSVLGGPYAIGLLCGDRVTVFTPDRFHEIQAEVDRLVSWGHELADIDLQLLEVDASVAADRE